MVFTKIEIDIAKQLTKLGLMIMFSVIIIVFLFNIGNIIKFNYSIKVDNFVDTQSKEKKKEVIPPQNIIRELPLSIEIPDNGIYSVIQSPNTTDVKILDNALSKGAVYYPGSGTPGYDNTLIFGHSTGFKVVMNKAYQVFNNIKSVKPGTLIYIKTQSQVHVYKTREVKRVSKYTSWIQFKSDNPILTLATCDSFGRASDRWVLTADYVGVK